MPKGTGFSPHKNNTKSMRASVSEGRLIQAEPAQQLLMLTVAMLPVLQSLRSQIHPG